MNFVLSPCNIFLLINADMASVHAVETFFEKWQGLCFSFGAYNGKQWGREIYQDRKAFFTCNDGEALKVYLGVVAFVKFLNFIATVLTLCGCFYKKAWTLMFLYLPHEQDQANQTNQTNVHVYPDWAAMQVTYLFPLIPLSINDWSVHSSFSLANFNVNNCSYILVVLSSSTLTWSILNPHQRLGVKSYL